MRNIRVCLCLFLVVVILIGWGTSQWIQSPLGAQALSRWVTASVARQVPGTQVVVRHLRWRWPIEFKASELWWGRPGQSPILVSDDLRMKIHGGALLQGHLSWDSRVHVNHLDLTGLDQLFENGKWGAHGFLTGSVHCGGKEWALDEVDLQLKAEAQGGALGGEVIERLLSLMPNGDNRAQLLKALRKQKIFHFRVGTLSVATEGNIYRLNLLLDGDHLLDLTVRVPKESVKILEDLVSP